ncbi:hypothetical protein AS034_11285 [[Bacillus] enclensis]|uniref:Peptidase propeptide and YPEB domain-containing protein n=1 Tax=[Bacillus] enclensis TaxID=1402860 RepID=A0A0V8HJG9_9BACI|nr:hypothetical protein [[Bacillus] enclensis]KSU62686.1 hypothetical protein AS034_11285 [[Bacillus] enclensis]OAT82670.1 hypothetical protein A6P54_09025 [Bacillus sp. MKU004]SCC08033.1 hypothetical protein GA0061094_2339 [[Bacillus] enclensis]
MNLKLLIFPGAGIIIMIGIFLWNDARTLPVEQSDLPVNRTLAAEISQRYLAGWWKAPSKLESTPYKIKDIQITREEVSVELLDERDNSECEGYEVVINRNNGIVQGKEEIDFCR